MKKSIFFIVFYSVLNSAFSQRILYVDDFIKILGEENKEDKLLSLARDNNFKTLILYDLDKIDKKLFHLADSTKNNSLINFIKKAKTNYNIKEIGASGENGDFFINEIDVYNKSRKEDTEKFDLYNLEYEYWNSSESDLGGYYCENYLRKNGIPCTREGSYKYYLETLSIMNLLAKDSKHPIKVEAYIGNYQNNEIVNITNNVDRLLVSSYEKTIADTFKNVKKRLDIINNTHNNIEVSIIVSAETKYLGGYLKYNSLDNLEESFLKNLKQEFKNLKISGFTYYNYSNLSKSLTFYNKRVYGK